MKYLLASICFVYLAGFSQQVDTLAIDSIYSEWENENGPGGAIGIIQNGELIFEKGYGLANIERKIPNSSDIRFQVGSVTKQFTAACILILIEQGKLSLESTLDEFFTEFPQYSKKIKIQHLLNHSSGLKEYFTLLFFKYRKGFDYHPNEDIWHLIFAQESLVFEPGDQYAYSNTGYVILARIVEKISGQTITEFAKTEIFDPLGMENTCLGQCDVDSLYTQVPYKIEEGKFKRYVTEHRIGEPGLLGDGGLTTTINDWLKWNNAFFDTTHFSAKFWEMLTEPAKFKSGEDMFYASGIAVRKHKGVKMLSHGGYFPGFQTQWLFFPEQDFAIISYSNYDQGDPWSKSFKIVDMFLSDQFIEERNESTEIDIDTADLSKKQLKFFTGKYWTPVWKEFCTIQLKKGKLIYNSSGKDWDLVPIAENKLIFPEDGETLEFFENKDGLIEIKRTIVKPNKFVFNSIKYSDYKVTTNDLKAYSGEYYSKELDVNYKFFVENDSLYIKANEIVSKNLEIIAKDHFKIENTTYSFVRNLNKEVIGFEIRKEDIGFIYFDKIN